MLTQLNNENEELKYRMRETNRQMKHISTDYCNIISKLYLSAFNMRLNESEIDFNPTLNSNVYLHLIRYYYGIS